MAQNTGIEWTDHTLNLWWGCAEVHSGCDHCYAREWAKRWQGNIWGIDYPRVEKPKAFQELAKWQKAAEREGVQKYVFCGSMSDIFERPMPVIREGVLQAYKTDALRNRLFQEISENWYPNLIFQFLTKRPSNIPKMIPDSWEFRSPRNVMFGTSISTQKDEKLIEQLLKVNGKLFLSVEPLLGHINLPLMSCGNCGELSKDLDFPCKICNHSYHADANNYKKEIDWVIVGGESGAKARPMHPDWVRSIRNQCQEAGVPFFFKQWGEYISYEETAQPPFWYNSSTGKEIDAHLIRASIDDFYFGYDLDFDDKVHFLKVGKKAAGNMLDCKVYQEFPIF